MDEEVGWFDIPVYHVILMYDLESHADLHEYILHFGLTEPASLGLDVALEILLAVLQEEVEMLGRFGRLIELDDVGAFQFEKDLNFPPNNFFILDAFKRDGLDCQQLTFVILDVASVDCPEASLAQLDGGYHVSLDDFAGHPSDLKQGK